MTTMTASKKWNCSLGWVQKRCAEGMIPLAEKNTIWDIPDTATKPPCTRHRAVVLMRLLQQKSEGKNVELFPGNDRETNEETYLYLSANGFITKLKGKNLEKELASAEVLKDGLALIESEEAENKKKKVSVSTEVSAGVKTNHVEASVKRTTQSGGKN